MPVQIDIEPTASCNLSCRMCPNGRLARERGFLDPALFREIVDQSLATTLEYHFDMLGEPLLHGDALAMLSYAVARGAKVALYTNLSRRDDALMRGLGAIAVDRVIVNLSATDAETYRAVHGRERFETVLRNLSLVRQARDRRGARRPRIIISHLELAVNRQESARAAEVLGPLGDQLWLGTIHDWLGSEGITELVPGSRRGRAWLKCSRPWTSASVLWDGRLATCCYDHAGVNTLGDLRRASLRHVWNSPAIRDFRRGHRRVEPCRSCVDHDHQLLPSNLSFLLRNWLRRPGRG